MTIMLIITRIMIFCRELASFDLMMKLDVGLKNCPTKYMIGVSQNERFISSFINSSKIMVSAVRDKVFPSKWLESMCNNSAVYHIYQH